MNSKTTIYLITSILAFALLANVNVGAVFATGGLDDEEEEEAIEELQSAVQEIKGTLGTIELNLTEGSNDIQANCPSTEEIVQEVVENITNNNNNNNTEEQPQCPLVPEEPEPVEPQIPNQTVIPPVQNNTETGCNPVPEPEPVQNETSDLVPIICPINGELLGYTNTTSGQQLPISAVVGNETQPQSNNTGFLPPIEIPTEQNQTVVPEPAPQQCNVTAPQEPQEQPSIVPQEQNNVTTNNPVEFDVNCGCYAVDKSTEEVQ
jgi:hypothetical protein